MLYVSIVTVNLYYMYTVISNPAGSLTSIAAFMGIRFVFYTATGKMCIVLRKNANISLVCGCGTNLGNFLY